MRVTSLAQDLHCGLAAILGGALVLAAVVYLAFGVVFYLRLADVKGLLRPAQRQPPGSDRL